jgi:hypothetical protein
MLRLTLSLRNLPNDGQLGKAPQSVVAVHA